VVTADLNIRTFFGERWGQSYRGPARSAHNRFVPARHPVTGEPVYLVGVAVVPPLRAAPPHNGSSYFLCRADGRHEAVEIVDPARLLPVGRALDGTRAIEVSSLPKDLGRVFQFRGYDPAGRQNHNTAWIVKSASRELP
jgi:hypothetical protein